MIDQTLDCLTADEDGALPLHTVRPGHLEPFLAGLPDAQRSWLRATGFTAKPGVLRLLPGADGIDGAVLGLGEDRSPHVFGGLPAQLPEGTVWRLASGDHDTSAATLGFVLGAYRYTGIKPAARRFATLVAGPDQSAARSIAAAAWMVRDLINTPPNLLGPAELADAARLLGTRHGATVNIVEGRALEEGYPAVAAVGRGSARLPRVVTLRWRGSEAGGDAPLVSLCGKGVCFDTGGYDLKPSAGMLRMKKDMGGAAVALGVARLAMEADLPIRLVTRIGCVENSVSGTAMRPSDVIRTRSGLTVEVGNTDAEGRLVLCDLLTDASAEEPSVLFDFATLTGAARVALGPDVPALFCDDDAWAETLSRAGAVVFDPVWRLPLWSGYDDWLKSPIADLNNVSSKPFAGAIVAALFLKRFVTKDIIHAHIDLYGWNDQTRPGRPEGGEAQSMRAVFAALQQRFDPTARRD
ncbi:MAG: leucyl aminopeptidase family protein [Acetobacteraceae bacterium]|nr:leucyl aminopeptidase family protein [Acetobacteraceae bacterium]